MGLDSTDIWGDEEEGKKKKKPGKRPLFGVFGKRSAPKDKDPDAGSEFDPWADPPKRKPEQGPKRAPRSAPQPRRAARPKAVPTRPSSTPRSAPRAPREQSLAPPMRISPSGKSRAQVRMVPDGEGNTLETIKEMAAAEMSQLSAPELETVTRFGDALAREVEVFFAVRSKCHDKRVKNDYKTYNVKRGGALEERVTEDSDQLRRIEQALVSEIPPHLIRVLNHRKESTTGINGVKIFNHPEDDEKAVVQCIGRNDLRRANISHFTLILPKSSEALKALKEPKNGRLHTFILRHAALAISADNLALFPPLAGGKPLGTAPNPTMVVDHREGNYSYVPDTSTPDIVPELGLLPNDQKSAEGLYAKCGTPLGGLANEIVCLAPR